MMNYYKYELDGETDIMDCSDLDLWPFFSRVAMEIAMSDCTGVTVTEIVYEGVHYRYAGWRPGMEFEFLNADDPNGESYTTWMEHLDH